MSRSADPRDRGEGFTIGPTDRIFEVNRAELEQAIQPRWNLTFLGEVDLTSVDHIRSQAISYRKPSYTAFVVKAVATALREHPIANRRLCQIGIWPILRSRLQSFTRRDIAVAIERESESADGICFVAVVRDADDVPLEKINADLHAQRHEHVTSHEGWTEFADRPKGSESWKSILSTRKSPLSPAEWVKEKGGAILVSSPALNHVEVIGGCWSHPLAVSLGIARERAVVEDQKVVVRKTCTLSLSYDRRLMTRGQAARFFQRVLEILENAETEMRPFILQEAPQTREDFPTVDEATRKV